MTCPRAGYKWLALCCSVLMAPGLRGEEGTKTGASPPADAGGEAPVLFIEEPIFNWGKAFRGAQLRHTFTLENRGKSPLVLEGAKPNCGCMSLQDEKEAKRTLQPGEKGAITLLIDTTILEPGLIKNKHTEILSNAGAGDNRLSIEGEIEALFQLDPPQPKVEVVRAHLAPEPKATVIKLTPLETQNVVLRGVKSLKGILEPSLKLPAGADRHALVSLLPRLKERAAFQADSLEIDTEVNGVPLPVRIAVSIVLKDRIEVTPSPSVFFLQRDTAKPQGASGSKPTKILEVQSIGGPGHRFRITGVAAREGVFKAAVETLEEGLRYRLTVTLEKAPQQGERFLKDKIELQTDDPEVPLLTIQGSARF